MHSSSTFNRNSPPPLGSIALVPAGAVADVSWRGANSAKGFALDIPLWLRFWLWLGARKNLGLWVPVWQAALKDTRSRHKRPPPRCAGPLHLFRFAARASLTAACQSGGRVTVICVRKILRICDPQIGNLTWSVGGWSWPRLAVASSWATSQALLLFNVAEAFTAICSWYLTTQEQNS